MHCKHVVSRKGSIPPDLIGRLSISQLAYRCSDLRIIDCNTNKKQTGKLITVLTRFSQIAKKLTYLGIELTSNAPNL